MRRCIRVVAFVCFVLLPTAARGGQILVDDFVGVTVGYFSPVTTGESRAVLGSVLMSGGTGISPAVNGRVFEAYCVDILGNIFYPGTPQPPATFDATAASMATWNLYSNATPFAGRYVSWLYNQYAFGIAAANDNVGRAGLLMAIWNVLYDADFTVDTGSFYVSARDVAVRAAANSYLNGLVGHLPAALASNATWLQLQDCSVSPCQDVQDFVGPVATAVPEPSAALLAVIGLVLVVRRRAK